MIERFRLPSSDGVTLEAKADIPERPSRVTVFCHPHPLQGGTMSAPLMIAVTRALVERGHVVVRFNFRGVGESTGTHELGTGEISDVDAAVEHARRFGFSIGLAGWSFGAGVALDWLALNQASYPYAGIAPPAEALPANLPAGPKRIILGTRDQVVDTERVREYAMEMGIDLILTPGDHFFHGRGEKIGRLVAEGLQN